MRPARTANRHFRIGVLGGMGPEAGVLLQLLIIRATPAQTDQEHLEVIAYTNPHVPDRTQSLAEDGGTSYVQAVIESLHLLEAAGVDVLVMACHTAHVRLADIERAVQTPMLNLVDLAKGEIMGVEGAVGILATDGTITSGLFSIRGQPRLTVTPGPELQREVMTAIRDIKAGARGAAVLGRLERAVAGLREAGCRKVVLGCTELSLVHDELRERQGDIFLDPLRLAATRLVELARQDASRK